MTVKFILFLVGISVAQAQTRYSPDSLMTAEQLKLARLVCEARGHNVPFFLDTSGGNTFGYTEDFADSTVYVVRMTEKTEKGVCARCRQTIARTEPEKELIRQRIWIDSTKFSLDSTGSLIVRPKRRGREQ